MSNTIFESKIEILENQPLYSGAVRAFKNRMYDNNRTIKWKHIKKHVILFQGLQHIRYMDRSFVTMYHGVLQFTMNNRNMYMHIEIHEEHCCPFPVEFTIHESLEDIVLPYCFKKLPYGYKKIYGPYNF